MNRLSFVRFIYFCQSPVVISNLQLLTFHSNATLTRFFAVENEPTLMINNCFLFYFKRRSEESADLLAEKSRVAEEEALLLGQKASEAEQEITRLRLSAMRKEEEKVTLERKTRQAEMLTARLVEDSERRAAEANRLKDELLRARSAEKHAKEKLLDFLSRNSYTGGSNTASPISVSVICVRVKILTDMMTFCSVSVGYHVVFGTSQSLFGRGFIHVGWGGCGDVTRTQFDN